MNKTDLLALASRVEAAQGADRALDADIEAARGWPDVAWTGNAQRYTASLDAAAALMPEGVAWSLSLQRSPDMGGRGWNAAAFNTRHVRGKAATPALALTAVALRAMAEDRNEQD